VAVVAFIFGSSGHCAYRHKLTAVSLRVQDLTVINFQVYGYGRDEHGTAQAQPPG
jgi:glucose-6-phosphate 1-dehydrogenase